MNVGYNDLIDELCKIKIEEKYNGYELAKIMNKVFPDKKCVNAVVTENTDKAFFGIMVNPLHKWVINLEPDGAQRPFEQYTLEIDSKLLYSDAVTGVDVAVAVYHDVEKMVSNEAQEYLLCAIDALVCGKNMASIRDIIEGTMFSTMKYCMLDALYNKFSISRQCNYEVALPTETWKVMNGEDAIVKFRETVKRITSIRSNLEDEIDAPDTIMLNWLFSICDEFSTSSTLPIYTLKKVIEVSGSATIRNLARGGLEGISFVSTSSNTYIEEASKNKASLFSRIKRNGMRSIEDDLYEFTMIMKNIDDEASAIQLMRRINNRMGIVSDYLENEPNISDRERERWEDLYQDLSKLRATMKSKPFYSKKMYGLFVDYNALMQNTAANQMTLNTMY